MDVKIVVIGRSKNEERNIGRFIEGYRLWVDEILIADGGSTDATLEIIRGYPAVRVLHFDQTFIPAPGIIRNPQGKHVNFLIKWAHEREADWIIFDDIDCFPTKDLQEHGRDIIQGCPHKVMFFRRLYVLHSDMYFPEMSEAGHGLYAWRAGELWADEQDPLRLAFTKTRYIPQEQRCNLEFPFAGLHCTWPTEEEIQRKMKFYKACWNTEVPHPTKSFGKLEKLPEWAHD